MDRTHRLNTSGHSPAVNNGYHPLLAAVSQQAAVRDMTIQEPAIEDIVRRVYARP